MFENENIRSTVFKL